MALPCAAIRRRSSVAACQRLFDTLLRASTRVDNLDDIHDAICHAAARFRHDASARGFVAHRHNLEVKVSIFARGNSISIDIGQFL
jgi:hypothetical protein